MLKYIENITLEDVKKNEAISTYIKRGDAVLSVMGYTDHSAGHTLKIAKTASDILTGFGYSHREVELVRIASYMHDIGNVVNRAYHAEAGAIISFTLLSNMGMPPEEIATIISAIGNHDEHNGKPISNISAALIIADKCDVRRSRVKNTDIATFDIHDRVNYAVEEAVLQIEEESREINLKLTVDLSMCSVMEYFEIFLSRMIMSARAAEFLKATFHLYINDSQLM